MKTTDLIAELSLSVATWGDCDVWVEDDTLIKIAGVEIWDGPHFSQHTVILRTENKISFNPCLELVSS